MTLLRRSAQPMDGQRQAGSGVGRALRQTVLREGATWRIPAGLGRGLRLEVDPGAPVHLYLGTAEVEIASHIRRFAQPGRWCLEVGSQSAYYALVLARLTGVAVTAFEFQDQALGQMGRNLALNPELGSRVEVVKGYVAAIDDPQGGLVITLDTFLASRADRPTFILVDVEGSEAQVLSGAARLLREYPPDLIVETHSRPLEDECGELLLDAGYRPRVVPQRRRLRERRGDGHNRWLIAQRPR